MKEYILTLCVAFAVCAVIGLFFDDCDEISKYIKLVMSLCIVCVVFIPTARNVLGGVYSGQGVFTDFSFENKESFKNAYTQYVAENTRQELEKKISEILFQKLGIIPVDISIEIYTKENTDENEIILELSKVKLVLDRKSDKASELIRSVCGIYPDISYTDDVG